MNANAGVRYIAAASVVSMFSMFPVCDGSAAVPMSRRAVWSEHDVTIELQHLPRAYACGELNNKVRDILAMIGARADMRVEASRCGSDLDPTLIAPWVQVAFSLPFEVHGELANSADMDAVERTVQIGPGSPPSIDSRDCQLLRQLDLTLFAEVPIRVDSDHLGCQSSTARHTPFSLSIEVLMPAATPSKVSLLRFPVRADAPRFATRTLPPPREFAV